MKKIAFAVLVIFFGVLLISGCGSSEKPAHDTLKTTQKAAGENSKFNRRTLLALSEQNYDMLYKYVNANNVDAAERMVKKGEVIWVDEGTKVTVLERSLAKVKLEITEGKHKGKTGYLAPEFIE